jgi:molybdate transport system ATP-binding protein
MSEPLVTLRDAAVRVGERTLFPGTNWVLRRGEHWSILGPTGSGKSLLAGALCGQVPVVGGGIRYHFPEGEERAWCPEGSVIRVSSDDHRRLLEAQAGFHQGRWHSSEDRAGASVEELLTRRSVEAIHPYQVLADRDDPQVFARRREEAIRAFGLEPLLGRRLVQLSSGEMKKLVLARAVARGPKLLVLDEPFAGLDAGFREALRAALDAMAEAGIGLVVATSRPEELPSCVRRALLVGDQRVVSELELPVCGPLPGAAPRYAAPARFAQPPGGGRPLLELREVTVRYGSVTALDRVSLRVAAGERWMISGPNGAGKSTLLSLVLADNPQAYANHVEVLGRRRGCGDSIWELKERIGWVSPEIHAYHPPAARVLDVVGSGFFGSVGLHAELGAERASRARDRLEQLLPGCADRTLAELSYGMQRLVFIARALVADPPLLILDEPCHGLDAAARNRVLAAVDGAVATGRTTLLYVTHQADEVPRSISHVLELSAGRVVRRGPR